MKPQETSSPSISSAVLRGAIYGSIIGSVITAGFSSLSTSALTAADGVFGQYFINIVTSACGTADGVVTSFDVNPASYGARICTSFQSMLDTKNIYTRSGNVGINNSNPTERLDVSGNMKVSGSSTVGGNSTVTGNQTVGGTALVSGNSTINGNATVAGTTTISGTGVIGGRLGVGLVNPAYKLDINGDALVRGNTQANVFYDGNNGNYYIDPDGTSNMNTVRASTFSGSTICLSGDCKTAWPNGFSSSTLPPTTTTAACDGTSSGSLSWNISYATSSSSLGFPPGGCPSGNNYYINQDNGQCYQTTTTIEARKYQCQYKYGCISWRFSTCRAYGWTYGWIDMGQL